MLPRVVEGQLILRAWDRSSGLSETSAPFASLDELYAYCLSASNPQLVDRIVIRGQDAKDQPRVLTFVFQSITVTSKPD
jgi:hypothetical protein